MDIQRNTVQRQMVLDAVKKLDSHPTVDEVFTEACKEHPSISKTTVYRNLRQLAGNNAIRQVFMADGLERYDFVTERHCHFSCKKCGNIIDVEVDYIESLDELVRKKYGFTVDEHIIMFSGFCVDCANERKKV